MNQEMVQGKWKEIKGEIRRIWGEVTDDDLDKAKGDITAISGIIEQRYGQKKEDITRGLKGIYDRFTASAAETTEQVKEGLRSDRQH